MNRTYRTLAAALCALLLATGCQSAGNGGGVPASSGAAPSGAAPSGAASSSAAPSAGAPAAKGDAVKLRFSWWGGDARHEATLKVMEQYAAKNPGVTLEGEYGGFDGYLEKMITQMAANTAPDILQIDYAFLAPFWKQMDTFVDFSKDSTVDKSGFGQGMLEGITAPSGELIGLPTGLNFSILFANPKVAEQYGIDLTKPFTWDKLLEDGKKVHAQNPEAYLLFPSSVNRYVFEPYLFNLTGKKLVDDDYSLGFDRESLVKTYQFVKELYDSGVMQPYDEVVEIKSPYESPKWLSGDIVMFPDFSSGFDPAKASLPEGVVSMPPMGDSAAENTGIVLRPTNMLSVNAKGTNPAQALEFVNYFFNDLEAIDTLGLVRAVPSTSKALDRMVETDRLDAELKSVADWAAEHKGGAGQNIISTNTELETIETDVLAALYYGDLTPETAADEFMKLMTDKVAELKEIAQKD